MIAPEAQTNATSGDTVLFTCVSVTYGNTVSTISWSRGDEALLNDSQRIAIIEKEISNCDGCGVAFVYSILQICSVGSVDASDGYTCTAASNGENVDNATFELQRKYSTAIKKYMYTTLLSVSR